MRFRLGDELIALGCDLGEDEFNQRVADSFNLRYRDFTVDKLQTNPREGLDFCNTYRGYLHLPDSERADICIMKALLNIRKDGEGKVNRGNPRP